MTVSYGWSNPAARAYLGFLFAACGAGLLLAQWNWIGWVFGGLFLAWGVALEVAAVRTWRRRKAYHPAGPLDWPGPNGADPAPAPEAE